MEINHAPLIDDSLKLSESVRDALFLGGFDFVSELECASDDTLLAIRNIGLQRLAKIRTALRSRD